MAPAADHVLVQLAIDSVGLGRQGYGEMMIPSHAAPFPERLRRYTSLAAAVPGDFAADSAEGRALAAAFAQKPRPVSVAVGRCAGTVTQRYDFSLASVQVGEVYAFAVKGKGVTDTSVSYTALANLDFAPGDVTTGTDSIAETAHGMLTGDGPYRVSNAGGGLPAGLVVDTNYWIIAVDANNYKLATSRANALATTAVDLTTAGTGTHTLLRAANDVIIAQLVDRLNSVVGKNYTATQIAGAGDTDTGRVTGSAVNNWLSLAVTNATLLNVLNAQTHAAPSDVLLATDLAAILLADSGWFCVTTLYNSDAYIAAVEAWAESNGRIYVWDSCNTTCGTVVVGSGTDIGATSFGLGYANSMGCFYPAPATFLSMAEMGRWLPTTPGKATTKYKTLAGVTGLTLTDTFKGNLRARRMNTYEQVLPDRAFFWEGTVFSTIYRFLDITRNAFWLQDTGQTDVLEILAGQDIVLFENPGIITLEGGLRGTGNTAEQQGVLAPGWTVTAPDESEISPTDKADRNLPGLKLEGKFAGAIHTAKPINVVVTF